jgi:iron complex outermembrane receptor protein
MKTRMFRLTFMLCVGFSSIAFSQLKPKIEGLVSDPNGLPLSSVNIQLMESYLKTQTDDKGLFQFTDLTLGTYSIRFTRLGYASKELTVDVKDNLTRIELTLEPVVLMIEEIQVSAIRATNQTPTTYTNLNKEELARNNFGQDIPILLQSTPSTVVTSDAGTGIGYTGIRIRGVDPTRTNVTINGVPLNDAESHGVYWVNMPDFASSTDNIQIQRGVGTSTNGAAAFGASINIKSDNIEKKAYAEIDNSAGSFGTLRTTVKAGTGLINDHFAVDARLSRIQSDGYVDRASANLKSFYLSGAWIGKKSLIKANVFSGKEVTYQSWYGVPGAKLSGDQDSLLQHFYNNYYPGGLYQNAQDSINLFSSDARTYNYYRYQNEEDNYQQDHYQLHFSHQFSPKVALNVSGHYTRGKGYYEQYRYNESFDVYGLDTLFVGGDTISTTDLIRRRWLDNHFYGGLFTLTYTNQKRLNLIFGGGANQYVGGHFGELIWARYASQSEIGDHYYDSDALKTEISGFVKANYRVKKWNLFADLQLRSLNYGYTGLAQNAGEIVPVDQRVHFLFFNPKIGFRYDWNTKNGIYASYAVANREPVRDDFIQSTANSRPKPEQLQNIEAGYQHQDNKWFTRLNYFLMQYKDQLILTGAINDVGEYNRTNVARSYRTGIELEAGYRPIKALSLTGNITLSQNKIAAFSEYVDNYDNYDSLGNMIQDVIEHTNTDIAFSPRLIAAVGIGYEPIKNLEINILGKYVGEQFLDNTSSDQRMLGDYFVTNLALSYSIAKWGLKELKLGIQVNNLFNEMYENNGYTWGYVYGGQRITENYYYPQAGRHFLARLSIRL